MTTAQYRVGQWASTSSRRVRRFFLQRFAPVESVPASAGCMIRCIFNQATAFQKRKLEFKEERACLERPHAQTLVVVVFLIPLFEVTVQVADLSSLCPFSSFSLCSTFSFTVQPRLLK